MCFWCVASEVSSVELFVLWIYAIRGHMDKSEFASALGKLGRGKRKCYSPDELARRNCKVARVRQKLQGSVIVADKNKSNQVLTP